jgi:SEC-C motif
MTKIGRNDPCPCGGGKKYKHCHGSTSRVAALPPAHARAFDRNDAERLQRQRQQGLGKPIVSAEINGHRFVRVRDRWLSSERWRTVEDFLGDYIKTALGIEWGNAEISKPLDQRHPILIWYQKVADHQRKFVKEPGKVHSVPATGAVSAYLHLAYDLYLLRHNAELQDRLLARLRNNDQFTGAQYEVHVAAAFVRSGFDIQYEDEQDGNTTHCEFTAIHCKTRKCFSVEAKRRKGTRFNLGHLLNAALSKHANHQRVVFIELNYRDDASDVWPPRFLAKALGKLRASDGQLLNGQHLPPAYVFVTNTPHDLYLDSPDPRCAVLAEGFQIPTFKGGGSASLRDVIEARLAHVEMHDLKKSLEDHSEIPSTFDGQMPEYAFNSDLRRILIGQHYMVPGLDGLERPAVVTAATVSETQQVALCMVTFEDGQSGIIPCPLSDEELAAWRRHPNTFFGVVGQRKASANSLLEIYDFFHESFKQETKERLLEVMKTAPDLERLAKLDQPALASIHAERMAIAAFSMSAKASSPHA